MFLKGYLFIHIDHLKPFIPSLFSFIYQNKHSQNVIKYPVNLFEYYPHPKSSVNFHNYRTFLMHICKKRGINLH